jgi:outer membrane protein OmpA-like peptidoglycan-associated protein
MYNARVTSTTGQNNLIISMQINAAEKRMVRSFDEEQASATPGRVDLISGVSLMAQHLHVLPHKTTDVVIFGAADQTAGPVNLADPLQLADPEATLQTVAAKGLLRPGECLGWRVYMVDGSLTPAGGLTALQDEQLREFWREFFARCGGELVVWDNTLITFPASGHIAPASWSAPGHREIIVSLPGSVLFRPNRTALLPGATQILDKLARELTVRYPRATADIAGYTAAVTVRGPSARSLSWARAWAVAVYLEARGVRPSRLAVRGYGSQHQIATDATAAGQARNRRVVVTLYPVGLRRIRDARENKK